MSYQRFSAEQSARLADNVSKQPASSWSFLPFSLFSPYRFFLDFIHSKCYGNRSPSRRYSQIVPLRSRTRPNDLARFCLVSQQFLTRLNLSSITPRPSLRSSETTSGREEGFSPIPALDSLALFTRSLLSPKSLANSAWPDNNAMKRW